MENIGVFNGAHGADHFGFRGLACSLESDAPALYEDAIAAARRRSSRAARCCAETGVHTGRSPKDKFIVRDATTENDVWWDGNASITPEQFELLLEDFIDARATARSCSRRTSSAAPTRHTACRPASITELAWHSLFIRNLLIRPERGELHGFVPELTIIDLPSFKADPQAPRRAHRDGHRLDFTRKIVLIGGTSYAGEMKKSVFTILNFFLPAQGVMPMHCSANVGRDGDTAIFFGLSGTGKTTLSADPNRTLIGDDEHGWGPDGVFNFEGGCYAKMIHLSRRGRAGDLRDHEALRHGAGERRDRSGDARARTTTTTARPRTRASPIRSTSSPTPRATGRAGHPKNIVMLTADAFGVLPPIAKLTPAQAMYHFLSGYTAKVAGTEKGVDGAAADVLDLLRRAVHAAPPVRLRQPAARAASPSTRSTAGWSTPAGPAAPTASAAACRSR